MGTRLPLAQRLNGRYPNYAPGHWEQDPQGKPRASIPFEQLKELWIFTGSNCNLACEGCYTDSYPGNHEFEHPTLDDVKPFIDEAVTLGVSKFNLTGGEPFLNPEGIEIMQYCLEFAPTLILTNGLKPTRRGAKELAMRMLEFDPSYRVSLDSPFEQDHNASRDPEGKYATRGLSVFEDTVATITYLQSQFKVSIAGRIPHGAEKQDVERRYRIMMHEKGFSKLDLVLFPEFNPQLEIPTITPDCITKYRGGNTSQYMCSNLRMVAKKDGKMQVYACTVVQDHPDFVMGKTLAESLGDTYMAHHRCYTMCFSGGASCSED